MMALTSALGPAGAFVSAPPPHFAAALQSPRKSSAAQLLGHTSSSLHAASLPLATTTSAAAAVVLVSMAAQRRRQQRRHRRAVAGHTAPAVQEVAAGLEGQVVDEDAMLAKSNFAIKPADLISVCKEVLGRGVGVMAGGEKDLASDFEFCAPVVGPIGKEEYLQALGTFKILDAFPDSNPNYHFFRVDPFEPDRVWFQTRKTGTNTGEFMKKPPTGKALVFPPEAYSIRFNEQGKVKEFTVGYPMDRRVGNTGGLGGAFGYFYGVGNPLPIPECKPFRRSWQFRLLSWVGKTFRRIEGVKVTKPGES
ncbi:unnamed protein product [Polarella glacialis]|uniref:Uncharacterized protein n=1 Tax=Polarella glacialis TaxID=89957 RepID=A0A813K2H3_POLGL|nr:unnamed protein product [Polarella glacialis]|mmetsp:Transcript_74103/g.133612  ORF Transcript_74103/g.133612 Transcript_74103/m.133612 type:complete len:307 (+) Transcript_74103:96-1016(+)